MSFHDEAMYTIPLCIDHLNRAGVELVCPLCPTPGLGAEARLH